MYETGVLRLLLRQNAMLYVSLLRSTFDPLTGELPRETVEERSFMPCFLLPLDSVAAQQAGDGADRIAQTQTVRFLLAQSLSALADAGEYAPERDAVPDLRRGRPSDPRRPDP